MNESGEWECECNLPIMDEDFSICWRCEGQLGMYHDCLRCKHHGNVNHLFGTYKCSVHGVMKISDTKKREHRECKELKKKKGESKIN